MPACQTVRQGWQTLARCVHGLNTAETRTVVASGRASVRRKIYCKPVLTTQQNMFKFTTHRGKPPILGNVGFLLFYGAFLLKKGGGGGELCNPQLASKWEKDTALLGNMTSSRFHLVFAVRFLLMWASHNPVSCLVDEKLSVQSATTVVYQSTEMMNGVANGTFGDTASPIACVKNPPSCMNLYAVCRNLYNGATMDCLYDLLDHICFCNFNEAMAAMNATDWCAWGNVSGLYSNLSLCTENISDCLGIPWPNPMVEETFVEIHHKFFKDCRMEELSDPPPPIIFALVITPILLIPVMVSLVVLKTKNGDGSS
ncbi:receptor activity-modifying protein 2 isoform 2-T2 [Syngnathus typhle]